jgi:hypothetical protein
MKLPLTDARGILVALAPGREPVLREAVSADVDIEISMPPAKTLPQTQILLAPDGNVSSTLIRVLRSALVSNGFALTSDTGTAAYLEHSRAAGGHENAALRAWARARYGVAAIVVARGRQTQRDIGTQDLGYRGLSDAAKGMIRTDVTVELEVIDVMTGSVHVVASGEDSVITLDQSDGVQRAAREASLRAIRIVQQKLAS